MLGNKNAGNTGRFKLRVVVAAGLAALAVAGCQDDSGGLGNARAYQPIPEPTLALMDKMGTTKYSPVLIRAFKKEAELEVWKMKADGAYGLLKTYPMCRWSGQLGPKRREGDRQVPEGFYYITPNKMNPRSSYYLSFNIGYPNAYDRAHGRTGSHIMVHGACSSRGCFSMTDSQISEIYAVVREAFAGGQKRIQLQSLPFRMTPTNLAKHRLDRNIKFWKKLKEGSDTFEIAKREPDILVCNRQYVFNATPTDPGARINPRGYCPSLTRNENLIAAVKQKETLDAQKIAALVSKGVNPIKLVYADGGQHRTFAHVTKVSRPAALASGPVEIPLDSRGRPIKVKPKRVKKTRLAKADSSKSAERANAGKSNTLANVTAFSATPAQTDKSTRKKPLLRRWFGNLLGGESKEAKPATSAVPAAAADDKKQVTPRSGKSNKVSSPRGRPNSNDKRASAGADLIRGAHIRLPPGLTAYAPVR